MIRELMAMFGYVPQGVQDEEVIRLQTQVLGLHGQVLDGIVERGKLHRQVLENEVKLEDMRQLLNEATREVRAARIRVPGSPLPSNELKELKKVLVRKENEISALKRQVEGK